MHHVVTDFVEAEHAFDFANKIRQFLSKFGILLGSLNEAQQFLSDQIFQRVANPEGIYYAPRLRIVQSIADEILFVTPAWQLSFLNAERTIRIYKAGRHRLKIPQTDNVQIVLALRRVFEAERIVLIKRPALPSRFLQPW